VKSEEILTSDWSKSCVNFLFQKHIKAGIPNGFVHHITAAYSLVIPNAPRRPFLSPFSSLQN
jgi:hypothetical protein